MKTWGSLVMVSALLTFAGCASNPSGGLSQVIASAEKVQLVQEGFVFTEGPVGTPDGGLYFTDLQKAQRIFYLSPQGQVSLLREKSNNVNGLALTRDGELIGVESQGQRVVRISKADGAFTEITRGNGRQAMMLPNDLIADARGGIYFTDPGPRPIPPGRKHHVYYLPPGATNAVIVDDNQTRPNGLTLTLDGKMLSVADTVEHVLHAWDVQADGTLGNRRPFLRLQGIPAGEDSGGDGMAVDRDGRFYVTSATGVQVFDRNGRYLGTIETPKRPSNVAFSGPNKSVLYITAREGLYRLRTLTAGPARLGK